MGFRCKKPNNVWTNVGYVYFYVRCPKLNLMCNSTSGAYVDAVTVCRQQLWT